MMVAAIKKWKLEAGVSAYIAQLGRSACKMQGLTTISVYRLLECHRWLH